jgi:hypothetical protein
MYPHICMSYYLLYAGVAVIQVASKEDGFDMDKNQISWFGTYQF